MTTHTETQRVVDGLTAMMLLDDHEVELINSTVSLLAKNAALIIRQREEIERLREALSGLMSNDPIIESLLWDDFADDQTGTFTITVGRIRAARAALEATK